MSELHVDKYNIICFSNQLWDFPNWTNKRHVMTRLAQQGHDVIFVDPPINLGFVLLRQIYRGLWSIGRILGWTKKDPSGATVYTPINLVPFADVTSKYHVKRIQKLSRKLFSPERKTILWVYHVQIRNLFDYINRLSHDLLVYDCVDNYSAFPDNQSVFSAIVSKSELMDQEKLLATEADIVFATAPGLVDKLKSWSDNVHFTPNVGDYPKFKDAKKIKEIPSDIKDIRRPVVAFTGALDSYKFDLELFKKLVREHPSVSFVLIGQIAMKDKGADLKAIGLADAENVHFLGQKAYSEIQNYYAAFDAYIIPYVLNDYTVGGCFPVKFHEALAVGIPTIVTNMPAYLPFKDVCYISRTYDEFSENVALALKEDTPDKVKQRQLVAKDNNWDGKVEKMLSLIKEQLN